MNNGHMLQLTTPSEKKKKSQAKAVVVTSQYGHQVSDTQARVGVRSHLAAME